MSGLRVRQPTGNVAYPLVLVEGAEKVGKTYTSLRLSASEHVGRTFVLDMGEGSADEYATLGPFEVVEHNGTFTDFMDQLKLATQEPQTDGKPNVIVIDSVTVLWESIKDWADARARKSKKAKNLLAHDPDAEVSIPMNIWTDAGDRWGQMIHTLRYWDGIGVLIARGKEVAKVGRDGQPVAGQTDYKVEAHKSTGFQVSAHLRCEAPRRTRLIAARSLHVEVPPAGLPIDADDPLEHVVFDLLGAGGNFATSTAVAPDSGRTSKEAKNELVTLCANAGAEDPKSAAADLWKQAGLNGATEITEGQWDALVAGVTTGAVPDAAPDEGGQS